MFSRILFFNDPIFESHLVTAQTDVNYIIIIHYIGIARILILMCT